MCHSLRKGLCNPSWYFTVVVFSGTMLRRSREVCRFCGKIVEEERRTRRESHKEDEKETYLVIKKVADEFKSLTLERVLKFLKAPVLKMTLFLLQRMKATMPITTINRKRGVRTAMIHRLLGGVFTTAAKMQTLFSKWWTCFFCEQLSQRVTFPWFEQSTHSAVVQGQETYYLPKHILFYRGSEHVT